MLGLLENELVALIKDSALGRRMKKVDSLPDTPDKDVLKRWGAEAPAAYVVAMDGAIEGVTATPKFVVVFVARNARGASEARHGDGKVIGLYEMLDVGIGLLNAGTTENAAWQVTGYQLMQDTALRDQGLQVGLVSVQAPVDVPTSSDVELGEFVEFHGDYDLEPHTPNEHQRWLNENHNAPAPDMQSHINLQEGV